MQDCDQIKDVKGTKMLNLACSPMVHSRMETLPDGSRAQTPHSPWAAGDWWRTGTPDGK